MRFFLAAIAAFALASCASTSTAPAASIAIAPGDTLTLQVSEAGITLVSREHGSASLTDVERASLAALGNNPAAMGPNSMPMPGDPSRAADSGRITVRFAVTAPHDTVLIISNGLDRALSYRASILVNDRATPTDVCWVRPGLFGYEHWPYLIDQIELSDLTLEAWRDGDALPCR